MSKKVAGLALACAVVLGAGAVAWADSGPGGTGSGAGASSGTSSAQQPAVTGRGGKVGGPGLAVLRRADHGDVEIKAKGGWETVTFDRGTVTAVSQGSITLARPDGQSATLAIVPATKFRGVGSWQDVKTGRPALVVSQGGTATQVVQRNKAAQG